MRFYEPVFIIRERLGKFCTVIPDNRTESKINQLKLKRNCFGT